VAKHKQRHLSHHPLENVDICPNNANDSCLCASTFVPVSWVTLPSIDMATRDHVQCSTFGLRSWACSLKACWKRI
jgi:hypothetical protein